MEINTGESTKKYHLTLANLNFIEIPKKTWNVGNDMVKIMTECFYMHIINMNMYKTIID